MSLRPGTCDGGARVFVDQNARQGMYSNGISIGIGVVEAKNIYYYNVCISIGENAEKGCIQCNGGMLAAMARR